MRWAKLAEGEELGSNPLPFANVADGISVYNREKRRGRTYGPNSPAAPPAAYPAFLGLCQVGRSHPECAAGSLGASNHATSHHRVQFLAG